MFERVSRLSWSYCLQEVAGILLSVIALFVLLSLLSYHATDQSLFYFSSQSTVLHNWCGVVGAHISAVLFFLFGKASFLIVGLLFFCSYLIVFHYSLSDEWDRFIGFLFLLFTVPVLLCLYLDTSSTPYAGGFIGHYGNRLFLHWFDRIGSLLFLYTLLISSLVLLFRFSCVGTYVYLKQSACIRRVCYYVSLPCTALLHGISYGVSVPSVWVTRRIKILIHGNYYDTHDDDEMQLPSTAYKASFVDDEDEEENTLDMHSEQKTHEEIKKKNTYCNGSKAKRYTLPNHAIFIGVDDEKDDKVLTAELEKRAEILEEKLTRFGIQGSVVSIKRGPVVTLFEYQPEIDTKISKIIALEDDLALALQAMSIRIIAPIPGRSVVGFEVANKNRKNVLMSTLIRSKTYRNFNGLLPLILGEDTIGESALVDLAKMPHLLVAGSTGSGKSVALNTMLISLLCNKSPDDLRLILIDPKRLEFAPYADIAHLLFPIVTDPKLAAPVLRWVVKEMEDRYKKMADRGARNIFDYRALLDKDDEPMPFIVVIIDELADLMMTSGRETEDLIARIAQMARAAGIHMIVATQRPSVDVITGLIKVNFPSRISFRVTSKIDSRTILDAPGADKLLGRGDMLFLDSSHTGLQRLHGAYVSDAEINQVVSHIKKERDVAYLDINTVCPKDGASDEHDDMFDDVCQYLKEVDEVSISLLQRKFRIGYNRSARIIEMLEAQGIIAPAYGGKTRKVLR